MQLFIGLMCECPHCLLYWQVEQHVISLGLHHPLQQQWGEHMWALVAHCCTISLSILLMNSRHVICLPHVFLIHNIEAFLYLCYKAV